MAANNINGVPPASISNIQMEEDEGAEMHHPPTSKEDLQAFLDSAAKSSERFVLSQGFYSEEEVPGTNRRLEERELERHHRTGLFPHSHHPLSHRHGHHRHHGHHKLKKKEHDKKSSEDNEKQEKIQPNLSTVSEHEDVSITPCSTSSLAEPGESSTSITEAKTADTTDAAPQSPISPIITVTPPEPQPSPQQPHKDTDGVKSPGVLSESSSAGGVGFYLGEHEHGSERIPTSEADASISHNVSAPSRLTEQETPSPALDDVTFFIGGTEEEATVSSPRSPRLGSVKGHHPLHKIRGSEIQLKEDRHIVPSELDLEERNELGDADVDTIASHRYDDSKGMRRRKISTHTISSVVHLNQADKDKKVKVSKRKKKVDRSPHEMFVELDELHCGSHQEWIWKEKARWIKFEEDVEEGGERWGKPHVASLSFHSLLELRKSIENGTVLLDLEDDDISHIANTVAAELVKSGQLDEDNSDYVVKALLLKHRHVDSQPGFIRRNMSHANLSNMMHSLQRRPSMPSSDIELGGQQAPGSPVESHDQAKKRRGSAFPFFKRNQSKDADTSDVELVGFEQLPQEKKGPEHVRISVDEMKSGEHVGFANHYGPHLTIAEEEEEEQKASIQRSFSSGSALDEAVTSPSSSHIPHILKCIPKDSEATSVLVGAVDFLKKPMLAFVRLSEGRKLGNLTAVPLPVRFIFILLGPHKGGMDYHEIGRSISTLMANTRFHEMAYMADSRQDLLDAINEFLDDSIVLPPGEWDKKTLLPIVEMAKKRVLAKRKQREREAAEAAVPKDKYGDPLQRTRRPFGGLYNDIRRRYPKYLSDIKDGLNMQCLATFFFIYFACLSPAITFGGLLGEKTDKYMGVTEMLMGVSICGVIFALLSGQPLLIIGATGPLLVFEEALFQICNSMGVDFIAFRCWCGFWMTAITVTMVGFEGSFLVRYFTRFVQEIFASLISIIFIFEVFKKLYDIFQRHPLLAYYPYPPPVPNMTDDGVTSTMMPDNTTAASTPQLAEPNTALLSVILTFGTFLIAYFLKYFRNSKFLGRSIRRALGDFGIPIAIVIMVTIDYFIKNTFTEKLDVPDGLQPTDASKRGWVINPLGPDSRPLAVWHFFAAIVPALLVFILVFMESEITSTIVNKKDRKLKKGAGYHLDLFLIGIFATISGIFGLPFMCAATVRSVTHVSALSVFTRTNAPGESPVLEQVLEQRVTAIAVHIMIGISVLMGPILRQVPLAVLFGVFLYMGIASMSGIQMLTRVELLLMPVKHHPNVSYVRSVRLFKLHLFTFIQLLCLALLWVVKSTVAALAFPFILILLVPFRLHLMPKIFTEKELTHLDCEEEDAGDDSDEDEPDFYSQAHMPM